MLMKLSKHVKKSFVITLLATGLVIGTLLTWQFSTDVPVEGNFPADELLAKEDLMRDFLEEQAYLQGQIVALRSEIAGSQEAFESQSEQANFALLERLKSVIGLSEISGAGLEVVLDDSPFTVRREGENAGSNLVQASDIRDVVNLLRAARAEAISVNDQRIIANSPISSVGSTVLVNNAHITPPFKIKALGDADLMLQRLLSENLLPNLYKRSREMGIVFSMSKKPGLKIGIYNGGLKTNYLNSVVE